MRDDRHPVPRFFAFRSDRRMREALAGCFRVLSFTTVDAGRNHFQSFMLEKPATAPDPPHESGHEASAGRAGDDAGPGGCGCLSCSRMRRLAAA